MSSKDLDQDLEIGESWDVVSGIQELLYKSGVKRIYNFTEYNGLLYASTNVGVLRGNLDGTSWQLVGTVGNIESLSGGRVLGQTFKIH